jgi:hypothetical protein
MRPYVAASLLAGLAFGCNCNTQTHSAGGQIQVPATLDFGPACVKASDPSYVVLPAIKSLTVQNVGVGSIGIASIQVDQNPPFSVPADAGLADLAGGASFDLPVSFLPTAPGNASTNLTVTDSAGKKATTALTGSGSSTANPFPVALLHCPGGTAAVDGGTADRCYDPNSQQTSANPLLWFSDTVSGSHEDLNIVVNNAGCARLDVSSVTLDGGAFALLDASGSPVTGTYPAFSVQGGIGPPQSSPVGVRFQPTSAGAAQGTVTLTTNDPANPSVTVNLLGLGVAPSLELCATVGGTQACSTATIPATCNFGGTPACTGAFVATNSGQSPITLVTISLLHNDPQFKITTEPSLPATLQATGNAGDSANIQISYTPRVQSDSDVLQVTSTGGTLQANVQGGNPPQLVIVPAQGDLADTVDFNKDSGGGTISLPNGFTGSKTFQIKNVGSGALTVQQVIFHDTGTTSWPSGAPYPYFQLTPPPANTMVQPNATTNVMVQYTDPPSGGPSGTAPLSTTIEIDSDDPLWPPASGGKSVTVQAKTPCDPPPVAVINGPMTVVPKNTVVTLDGSASYHTIPDSNQSCQPGIQCTQSPPVAGCPNNPISHWEWSLQSVSADAGTVTLTPSGLTTSPTTRLTLGGCSLCSYVVRLYAYDDTITAMNPDGNKSAYTEFTVNAQ